jgi:predicted Zn-dependent protease
MQILEKLDRARPVEFFSTHPNPESRIAYLQDKIATRYSSLGGLKKGQEEYSQKVLAPLKERKKRFNAPPADVAQPGTPPSGVSGSSDTPTGEK